MKTLYKKITDNSEKNHLAIKEAAEIIISGGLVAFPTETVYGLGANALNCDAAKSIYEAKGRPSDNPLIVHISSKRMLDEIADDISDKARMLADIFWPGPLTLVLKKKSVIPDVISGGLNTVAVRMPENNVALSLIAESGVPIAAPSANSSTKPSPTCAQHVLDDLDGKINMVLDGGHTVYGVESTIVDVSGPEVKLLRPGGVTVDMLKEVIGEVSICAELLKDGEKPPAPGMKYKHYAPKAPLTIVKGKCRNEVVEYIKAEIGGNIKNTAIITTEESFGLYEDKYNLYSFGPESRPDIIAENLFDILRQLDEDGIERIFAHAVGERGMGHAVMNRLTKAAGYNIIDLDRDKPVKAVLFVCTGNTCRSPMAEAIFNSISAEYAASSRGMSVFPGSVVSRNSKLVMEEMGLSLADFKPAPISENDVRKAELVLCMTGHHAEFVKRMFPEYRDKVYTLHEYADNIQADVSDPFGGDVEVYRQCAEELGRLINLVLDKLEEKN